jgi:hypothetical protein
MVLNPGCRRLLFVVGPLETDIPEQKNFLSSIFQDGPHKKYETRLLVLPFPYLLRRIVKK